MLPTDKYLYWKKEEERSDFAFFNPKYETYYIGESKDRLYSLLSNIRYEEQKAQNLLKKIQRSLNIMCKYEIFALFKGVSNDVNEVFNKSNFNIVAIIQENNDEIILEINKR